MKHRILLQTNPLWLLTGLSRNAKNLLSYLWKTNKYEIAHYCSQSTLANDPRLALTPWKSFGCIPADQEIVNRINSDPVFARDASYGAINVESVVKEWKPSIWIGSDDIWSYPLAQYSDAAWFKRVHGLHHITVDSVPVLDQAFEQAKRSKNYLTWAKFASKEMKRVGGAEMSHVDSIYGMIDNNNFTPISESEKLDMRRRFNIPADMMIFLFVGRNQLRKSFLRVIEAFARFKRENPNIRASVLFHTSFSEKGQGWDLPKLAAYHGLKKEELLCTYVCKQCGSWLIAPFQGEDMKCPFCGADKGLVTASIVHGVPENQMKLIYGFSDASLSCMSSGGMEITISQSLLCGKPLAVTNYSCGEDVCTPETSSFVTPLGWLPYDEPGTNFTKATTKVTDIAAFMRRVTRLEKRDLQERAEKGRAWAVQTFGIETIGAQWEKLFEGLNPNVDWSSVEIKGEGQQVQRKNPAYEPPSIADNTVWLKDIYKNILCMTVADSDQGLLHWIEKLNHGVSRDQILKYFRSVAEQENAKMGAGSASPAAQTDLWAMLDKSTGKKRALFVCKESLGDCLMATQLFESFHEKYPNHDLYVATQPQYNDVFIGNPHVFRILPWFPACQSEMAMCGAGQKEQYFNVYLGMATLTQVHLGYLYQSP